MKKYLFISLFLFCSVCHADDFEKYVVDRPDGGISIVYVVNGSRDDIYDVLKSQGMEEYPYRRLEGELPSREDRDSWTRNGKKIVVDRDKKEAKQAQKAKREADKQAALAKLKLSEKELKDALGK